MRFTDKAVAELKLTTADGVRTLIVQHLCGEMIDEGLKPDEITLLERFMQNVHASGLSYEQFNELLLLLNQDRVSRVFFEFFFGLDPVYVDQLCEGVIRFKGYAMLRYGGFRYAFKKLSCAPTHDQLLRALWPYGSTAAQILDRYRLRPAKMLDIDPIKREETWYLGEVTGPLVEKETTAVKTLEQNAATSTETRSQLQSFLDDLGTMSKAYEAVQATGLRNTDVYLTWDYLDVYVATSMRNKWEFEDVHEFAQQVFAHKAVQDLGLRFFDPTQSKCRNARDKGLLEGLMLKRASCTIYMVQESDTLGKDSELAATLAQSKPVIAFVPKIDVESYSEKISGYALDYFYKRLLLLKADGTLEGHSCLLELDAVDPKCIGHINGFLGEYESYRRDAQPFKLWAKKDQLDFSSQKPYFQTLCRVLAIAEKHAFEKRAKVLRDLHPLAMQVDLQTGVANGVLVVRSAAECAETLRQVLLNEMEFEIQTSEGAQVLMEKRTHSQFRVVTTNVKLANSFWNLFAAGPAN